MQKANSLGRKSLSILLAVLMLVTCIPIVSLPLAGAVSNTYEVFGYVTLGPIIYTHGTKSYSHSDWPNDGRYDYMMNGTRIADGTFDGEASTPVSVAPGKGIASIEAYTSSMGRIGTASISVNSSNLLTGDFGSGFTYPRGNDYSKSVILKFIFADGTYEYHKLPVFSNPVAKNTVVANFGRCPSLQNRRAKVFEVLAKGSYGNVSESMASGGNSSYGGLFYDTNAFGGESKKNISTGNANYAAMYSPFSTVMDSWGTNHEWAVVGDCPVVHIDSLTDETLTTDKVPTFYAVYGHRSNAAVDAVIKTAHPAVYYLDISTNDNYGITNIGEQYAVDLFVGNLYFDKQTDFDDYPLAGANILTSSTSRKGVSLDTSGVPESGYLENNSASSYDLYLRGKAVAGETISASVYVKHLDVNEHDVNYPVLSGIYTDVKIYVSDKTTERYSYQSTISTLKSSIDSGSGYREQCYTPASWKNLRNAMLNLEYWLRNNTDTSDGSALKATVENAIENLQYSTNDADHDIFLREAASSEASCTEPSTESYACTLCNYTYETHNTSAQGHNYVTTTIEPTCTEQGYDRHFCSRCEDVINDNYTNALGHDWVLQSDDSVAPTCTRPGFDLYKCSRCNQTTEEDFDILDHSWNEGMITVEPGCLTKGVKTFTCSSCGATRTEDVDALGHEEEEIPATEATCITPGNTAGVKCSRCGTIIVPTKRVIGTHKYTNYTSNGDATCAKDGTKTAYCDYGCGSKVTVQDVGSKLNVAHTPGEPVREGGNPATCTDAGFYESVTYCSVCGTEISRVRVDEAATGVHNWRYESIDATCTVPGTVSKICTVCGATESEEGALKPHNPYFSKEAKPATCEEDGWTYEETCFICHNIVTASQTEEALGHDYVKVDEKAATCSEEGNIEYYTCSRCDKLFTKSGDEYTEVTDVVIPKLSHTPNTVVQEIPETCTDDGQTALILCEVCGETIQDISVITAPGSHNEYESLAAIPVSCEEEGRTAEISCSRCGEVITASEVIPATGHKARKVEGTPATCDDPGISEASVCWNENCQFKETNGTMEIDGVEYGIIVPQTVIPAAGHKWNNGKITTPATCTTEGVLTKTCTVCGLPKNESVPTIAHRYTELVSTEVPATCTDPGTTAVYKCATCDDTTGGEEIQPNGHSYEPFTLNPTCTEDGYTAQKCSVCGHETDIATISALNHDEVIFNENFVDADCTNRGSYDAVTVCNRCGAELARETVETNALGHVEADPVEENRVEATCTTAGSYDTVIYCKNCGIEISRVTTGITQGAHNFDTENGATIVSKTEATCTEDGLMVVKCANCNDTKDIVLGATGHTADEEVIENAVYTNCIDPGIGDKVVYCKVCRDVISRETNVEIPAKGHTPGETVIENVQTTSCENGGSYDEAVYCTVCGLEVSRDHVEFEPTGHKRGETIYDNFVDPTCTAKGSKDRVIKCAICGLEISRKTVYTDPALGHDFDESIVDNIQVVEATCTEPKTTVVKCSRCDETKALTTAGSALGHIPGDPVQENTISATCSEDGSYEEVVYCTREGCGAEISRRTVRIPKGAHVDVDPHDGICDNCEENCCEHENTTIVGATEASCITRLNGNTGDEICDLCGKIIKASAVIPWSHTIEIDPAVEPTCIATGLTAGSHCSVCGMVFDVQRTVPKTEHKQVIVPGTPATCITPGTSDAVVCETCGLIITEHRIINTTTHHVDNDGDGKCDNCGGDMASNCDCLCHKKSWISKAFYKFILFFWKLFKISKTCDCGAVHY